MHNTAAAIVIAATLAALPAAADPAAPMTSAAAPAGLRDAAPQVTLAQVTSERRRLPRVRIHRDSRPLGPDAKRHCEAWYEQEFRPSGTVIVPRMSCFWQRG